MPDVGGRFLASLIALALALAFAAESTSAATPIKPDPRNLTLRLVDLPPGYAIPREADCSHGFDEDPGPATIGELQRRHPSRHCVAEFEQLWSSSPGPYGPTLVSAGVLVFRDDAGANAGLAIGRDVVCVLTTVCGPGLRRRPPPEQIGDATALFEGGLGSFDKAVVIWRSGRMLGFVTISNERFDDTVEMALGLATREQSRIVTPTTLRASDNDDREVLLDVPGLDVDVYWLGRRFVPTSPRLPALRLLSAGLGSSKYGTGWRVRLDYGRRDGSPSLTIWKPRSWLHYKQSAQGRRFLCDRCGRRKRFRIGGKQVTAFAIPSECLAGALRKQRDGFGPFDLTASPRRTGRCTDRRPDRFIATVRLRDLIVAINLPDCIPCRKPSSSPYNSLAGVRAMARGLELREPR